MRGGKVRGIEGKKRKQMRNVWKCYRNRMSERKNEGMEYRKNKNGKCRENVKIAF